MFDWINVIYATQREVRRMAIDITELAAELTGIKALLVEATAELMAKITALEIALGETLELPEDAVIALEEVRAAAQALADVVPNDAQPA